MRLPLKRFTGTNKEPAAYSVCDVEAYKWTQFRVMGWYNGRDYQYFLSMYEFIEFCWEQPERIIYAHFGGIYDFMFILESVIRDTDYKIGPMIPRGSGLLCLDLIREVPIFDRNGNQAGTKEDKITFRDSSALLPFSLANLTKSFGVKHKKQDFNFDTWDGVVTQKLLGYLKDDCRGLYECITAFYNWDLVKKSGPAFTIASQAMKVFRLYLLKDISSLKPRVDSFIRKGYFGGRTEIFKPEFHSKTKNIYCYDVNSLYPTMMRNNEFPTNFKYWTLDYKSEVMGFYECHVDVPKDMYLPPLPYVATINKSQKLIFPTGRFKGVYSTVEIEYARSLGIKIRTGKGAVFQNGGYLFKTYIDELYRMRMEAKQRGDGVGDILTKLMMNSTYGRFGLNTDREQIIFDDFTVGLKEHCEIIVRKNGKDHRYRLMTKPIELERTFTNVAIPSWVTALSRIHMHKLMLPHQKHLFYTDSVTKDRMIPIKIGNDIKVIEIEKLFYLKESSDLIETVSWNPVNQSPEWKTIIRVIRHKVDKNIYRTRDNKGSSVTTEDHSFIDRFNNKISPLELDTLFSVKDLTRLNRENFKTLDLMDYLPESFEGKNSYYELRADLKNCWYERILETARRKDLDVIPKVQRFYEGDDLNNLLKILGYYIAEGSVSDMATTSSFSFAISSDKTVLHDELINYLNSFFKESNFSHIKSSDKDNTYKIINGSYLPCVVFKALGGQKSKGKFMPDFVFSLPSDMKQTFIDWLVLGDGCVLFGKNYSEKYRRENFRYDSQSRKLINQLSFLLSLMGKCHGIIYRKNKDIWTIATSKINIDKKPIIEKIEYDDYVYDLQVDGNNNFFDCEGMIGLHNTDSIFTTKQMETSEGLGGLKEEYRGKQAIFLLPKTYVVEDKQNDFKKIAMKGFDRKKISKFQYEDFLTALEGDLRLMKVTHDAKFAKFKTAARKGSFTSLLPSQTKQIRSQYDKRYIIKKGKKYDSVPRHLA